MSDKPYGSIERWVDLHGHQSYNVANLIVQNSDDEEELISYVYILLNLLTEDEVIKIVNEVNHNE
ncbi:hypothetical protein [Natronolimnobius baerhuensis]|uniref:Uncharacterized protein n=1 Tax=Natronolimnobius baerhuensis TaxID=253108 RepID=A0A202EA44_9EURY|nr:hypothetical protein [Natronolimnobius baerhuensis]OVE85089.1 hypothetical protein B2G88_12140 [Natronolimnobius baerhuensis]